MANSAAVMESSTDIRAMLDRLTALVIDNMTRLTTVEKRLNEGFQGIHERIDRLMAMYARTPIERFARVEPTAADERAED